MLKVQPLPFYRSKRECVSTFRVMLQREAVASVLVQPNSSKDVLTEKQRARVIEVQAILKRGENPFTKEQLDKQGKNQTGPVARIMVQREQSDEQVKGLEAKWSARHIHVEPPPRLGINLRAGLTPKDPAKIYCSFCQKEVDHTRATRGTGKTRMWVDTETIEVDGEKRMVDHVKVRAAKIIACPQCILNIKPTLDKYGKVVKNNIEFTTNE